MSKYKGLFTFGEDNHKYIPTAQADGIIDTMGYEPAKPEPLFKDEKILKTIKAWAECNNIPKHQILDVFEYMGTGTTAVQYWYYAKTKPYERCITLQFITSDKIYNKQNDRTYTIAELCGEEEVE